MLLAHADRSVCQVERQLDDKSNDLSSVVPMFCTQRASQIAAQVLCKYRESWIW